MRLQGNEELPSIRKYIAIVAYIAWFSLIVRIRIIVIFYYLRPSQLFTDKCEHTKWDIADILQQCRKYWVNRNGFYLIGTFPINCDNRGSYDELGQV